jgi:HD-like signal output (HDOD) protein
MLSSLHQLPMLSAVVQDVIASFKENHLAPSILAKISKDQGLSAKILRVANSSFYGLSRKVSSIPESALVIGFNGVRSLALSAGFVLAFPHNPDNSFDRRAYWLHSFRVAGYTQALAKCLGHDHQAAFTVGMFYEIGQLVLDVCIPEVFASILTEQKKSGANLIEIEQSKLGFDHAIIGAEMAKRWNFPQEIEHAILYWRTPEHEPFEFNTAMVHVAVLLESGLRGEELMDHLSGTLCERLGLSWNRIENIIPDPDQLDAEANQILDS